MQRRSVGSSLIEMRFWGVLLSVNAVLTTDVQLLYIHCQGVGLLKVCRGCTFRVYGCVLSRMPLGTGRGEPLVLRLTKGFGPGVTPPSLQTTETLTSAVWIFLASLGANKDSVPFELRLPGGQGHNCMVPAMPAWWCSCCHSHVLVVMKILR